MANKNVSLEKTLLQYRVLHTPTEFSWKQYWAKEAFTNDELYRCSEEEKKKFYKRLEECNITMFNNIRMTSGGKIITLKTLLDTITDPKRKNIKKTERNVIYSTQNGERPIGKKAFEEWCGFQVIDMDIKDETHAKCFKKQIFERLKKYNWFMGIAISSSGKGLHIYTKIQVPESSENDPIKKKILYLTNFRHKYSFVYLACMKIIEGTEVTKDDVLKWMDMAMFKPQQGAFVPYDEHPLINTHFFEDFIYVNFDNVEDMGHPDVDWVTYPDLKEVFKRWEWFEEQDEDHNIDIEVTDSPELEVDTHAKYHYKHFERWRLANTLVKLYGKDKGYNYLRMICTNDIRNKELQSDCITASRHDKPIELWAVNRLNKYHGFKIKVNVDHEETDLSEIYDAIDTIEDPTALKISNNIIEYNITKDEFLGNIREQLLRTFGRITLIEAGAGTGKTEMVRSLVNFNKKVMMVMPFTSTIKSKIEGTDKWNYSYGNKKIKFDKPGLALTVDKFSRLNLMELKDEGYDYIFIDESHLLFQSEYRPVMAKVIEMIRNTEIPIIMMSGTPIGEDIFFPDLVHIKINKEETRAKKFEVFISDSPSASLLHMCRSMAKDIVEGKRCLFPTNRGSLFKTEIQSIVKFFLENEFFYFEDVIINYYKKSNIGDDFMDDINFKKTINKTDILLCSTYLSVGVDILDRYNFNIYFDSIWTPQEIEQFANRLRSHDLYIRLYLSSKDSEGNPLFITKFAPCSFKLDENELKDVHSILRLCNGMIERNPIEYKYNSLISSIIRNNKYIEYNDIENKYYLNEIAYKTIFFERKYRVYAQQLPVLIKGMISYGYEYSSHSLGEFKFSQDNLFIENVEDIINTSKKAHKASNTKHIDELIDIMTEDRMTIYRDVMAGKYEIIKGNEWSESLMDMKMVVKNIEVFEKVVPIFVSMSKMYEIADIVDIFHHCVHKDGSYNFAAINRIRMLMNIIYNNRLKRLDLPILQFMNETYDFVAEHQMDDCPKATTFQINEFIGDFVEKYALMESKHGVDILLSPITLETMRKSLSNIFKCLITVGHPGKGGLCKMKKSELLWTEKKTREKKIQDLQDSKFFLLNDFIDAMKVDSQDVSVSEK